MARSEPLPRAEADRRNNSPTLVARSDSLPRAEAYRINNSPTSDTGSCAQQIWISMRKHSEAAHPCDWCYFEAPIIAERIKYYSVSIRWLEAQGALPSRPA